MEGDLSFMWQLKCPLQKVFPSQSYKLPPSHYYIALFTFSIEIIFLLFVYFLLPISFFSGMWIHGNRSLSSLLGAELYSQYLEGKKTPMALTIIILSQYKFNNLGELFQGCLRTKILKWNYLIPSLKSCSVTSCNTGKVFYFDDLFVEFISHPLSSVLNWKNIPID